jgi:hypothetical protein
MLRKLEAPKRVPCEDEFQQLNDLYTSLPTDVQSIIRDDCMRLVTLKEDILRRPWSYMTCPYRNIDRRKIWTRFFYDDDQVIRAIMEKQIWQINYSPQHHGSMVFAQHLYHFLKLVVSRSMGFRIVATGSRHVWGGWHQKLKIGEFAFHRFRHFIIQMIPSAVVYLDFNNNEVVDDLLQGRLPPHALLYSAVASDYTESLRKIPTKIFARFIREHPILVVVTSRFATPNYKELREVAFQSITTRLDENGFNLPRWENIYPSSKKLRVGVHLVHRFAQAIELSFWRSPKNHHIIKHFFKVGFARCLPKCIVSKELALELVRINPYDFQVVCKCVAKVIDGEKMGVWKLGVKLVKQDIIENTDEVLPMLLTGSLYMDCCQMDFISTALHHICCRCKHKRDCCVEVLADMHQKHSFPKKYLLQMYPFLAGPKRKRSELATWEKLRFVREAIRV